MCALFILVMPLCAQNGGVQGGGNATAENNAAANVQDGQFLKDSEKDLLINTESAPDSVSGGGMNTLWLFIRMIFVLALVIVCIYVLVYFLKKVLRSVRLKIRF